MFTVAWPVLPAKSRALAWQAMVVAVAERVVASCVPLSVPALQLKVGVTEVSRSSLAESVSATVSPLSMVVFAAVSVTVGAVVSGGVPPPPHAVITNVASTKSKLFRIFTAHPYCFKNDSRSAFPAHEMARVWRFADLYRRTKTAAN
jgi:hypothetical protein